MSQPASIGDILKRQLARRGVARRITEASVEHLWPEVVGEEIAARTKVVKIERGRVLVSVDDPAWRQELIYHKPALIDKLNAALKDDSQGTVVTDIMFTGP